MSAEDYDRRRVIRKTVLNKPTSYVGFSDVNLVSKNNLKKRKINNSFVADTLSAKSTRSASSPVKKYAKLDDKMTEHIKIEKLNHQYIAEQKKKWRQKMKNEEDSKVNLIERKKLCLQELQITSKLLLKKNLKRKAIKSKNLPQYLKNENSLESIRKSNTGVCNVIPEKYNLDNSAYSTDIKPVWDENSIQKNTLKKNVQSPATEREGVSLCSPKTSVPEETQNTSLSHSKSAARKSAAIKIQSSYRGYRARKHKEFSDLKDRGRECEKKVATENHLQENLPKLDGLSTDNVMCFDYPYNFIKAVKNKLSKTLDKNKKEEKDLSPQCFNISPIEKLRKECLNNPSFLKIYNKDLDSIFVMPTVKQFSNIDCNKPFFTEASSVMQHFDSKINNTSCEFSVIQRASNLTSLSQLKPDPRTTNEGLQKSAIISELKSSLQEIQNLTVSITFNEQVNNSEASLREFNLNDVNNKLAEKVYLCKPDPAHRVLSPCNSYPESQKHLPKCENNLNPPNINLIWSRKSDSYLKPNERKKSSPNILHKQFKTELNLLDSFNESLRQVQVVEETLSTMRQNLNLSNSSQFTDFHSQMSDKEMTPCISDLQSARENNLRKKILLEHKTKGITFNSPNSNSSFNLSTKNQIYSTVNSMKGKESKIKGESVNATFERNNSTSRTCSRNKIHSHNNTISNIIEQISIEQSRPAESKNIASLCDTSSDSTFHSKITGDVSLCEDLSLANQLNKFCFCLITQYIEDENIRSNYLNTLLKVREKTLLDATRLELLCLQMQKKQNHDLAPLLKKKQRGLLLKSQQERNEIKHIKKFQQEQSQERKATLRRQLKHLKRMFSCEGSVDFKKKGSNLQNSTLILQSKGSQFSPVKGVNISFNSDSKSNSTFCKLQENLEKKKMDLSNQKRKLNELLHMHYDVQLDAAEIKAMESRLKSSFIDSIMSDAKPIPNCNENVTNGDVPSVNIAIMERDDFTKAGNIEVSNNLNASDGDISTKTNLIQSLKTHQIESSHNKIRIHSKDETTNMSQFNLQTEYVKEVPDNISDESSDKPEPSNFVMSGFSLNKLWEKITGQTIKKYEDEEIYPMSKDALNLFFDNAKQFALNDLLKTLQCNMPDNNYYDHSKNVLEHASKIDNLHNYSDMSRQTNFTQNEHISNTSSKSKSPQSENTENPLVKQANEDYNSPNEDDDFKSQENILSETFTIKENLSTDSSHHSDSSNSTAYSLVEELTQLDLSKLNEQCDIDNLRMKNDFVSENNSENSTQLFERQSVITIQCSPFVSNSNTLNSKELINDSIINDQVSKNHKNSANQTKLEDENKHLDCSFITSLIENKPSQLKYVKCINTTDDTSHALENHSNIDIVQGIFEIEKPNINSIFYEKEKNDINAHDDLGSHQSDTIFSSNIESNLQKVTLKRCYPEEKIEKYKNVHLPDLKPGFHDILLVPEVVSPSPDQSPRDSPTGEYSPAAVSLSICRIDEAEELRKKQLAIELEIKALEQQSQLPFCLVREIPDKPPPPYIPPSEETSKLNVIVSPKPVKSAPKATHTIESYCNWLWDQFYQGNINVKYADFSKCDDIPLIEMNNKVYLFDICHENFEMEFEELNIKDCQLWEYDRKNRLKKFNKEEVCLRVERKVKEILGFEDESLKDNLIVNWAHKRQDYINDLLIEELYNEEVGWVNIEENEMDVKNELTNSVLDDLILEACIEYKAMYS